MRITLLFSALVLGVACGDDTTTSDSGTTDSGTTTATDSGTTGNTACADFCADYIATCIDTNATWADSDACETDCAGWALGTADDTTGDTLECRVYHVGAAATDADTHCPHASADGGGVCVDVD